MPYTDDVPISDHSTRFVRHGTLSEMPWRTEQVSLRRAYADAWTGIRYRDKAVSPCTRPRNNARGKGNGVRIGQFIDTFGYGGAESVVIDLCRELRDRSADVVLLHFGSEHLVSACERYAIPQLQVPNHRLYKRAVTLPRFALSLRRFLLEQNISVLHSHLLGAVVGAAPAARLAGITHIGTLHDTYSVEAQPRLLGALDISALLGTRLVTVSAAMERFYRDRLRWAGSLCTIYNGVRASTCERTRRQLRAHLGISEHELVLASIGRLVPLKRYDLLLYACRELTAEFPLRLLLIGDGPERADLERFAQRLGIADRVQFLGARDDARQLLGAADLYALVSDSEGLSCSILEAMAAGLPLVVTSVGGNPELVRHAYNGLLSSPGDSQALTQNLRVLLSANQVRRDFGSRSAALAADHFSLVACVNRYQSIYNPCYGAAA